MRVRLPLCHPAGPLLSASRLGAAQPFISGSRQEGKAGCLPQRAAAASRLLPPAAGPAVAGSRGPCRFAFHHSPMAVASTICPSPVYRPCLPTLCFPAGWRHGAQRHGLPCNRSRAAAAHGCGGRRFAPGHPRCGEAAFLCSNGAGAVAPHNVLGPPGCTGMRDCLLVSACSSARCPPACRVVDRPSSRQFSPSPTSINLY